MIPRKERPRVAHPPLPCPVGAEVKTVGMLIDELFTTNMKCWQAQEDVMRGGLDAATAEAAKRAQVLNKRRNELIRAIDQRLGQDGSPTGKTY